MIFFMFWSGSMSGAAGQGVGMREYVKGNNQKLEARPQAGPMLGRARSQAELGLRENTL